MSDTDDVRIWGNLRHFFVKYPESAIVLLVLILLPILSKFLPEDDSLGPVIWTVLIIIGLPALFSFLFRVIPFVSQGKTFRNVLSICFAVIVVTVTVTAIISLLHLSLPSASKNGGIISRVSILFFGLQEVAPPELTREPIVEATTLDDGPTIVTRPTEVRLGNAYGDCISESHENKNIDAILECTSLLEDQESD
ncbi:MAG: hypothetical protein WA790_15170 [Sulfitobacter sp.]